MALKENSNAINFYFSLKCSFFRKEFISTDIENISAQKTQLIAISFVINY